MLIDNTFLEFGGRICQQTIGIPVGTNYASSYGVEFIQGLVKAGKKRLAQHFTFTNRYINDVISLNNSNF